MMETKLDELITLVRRPIGWIAFFINYVFFYIAFFFETLSLMVCFPIGSIFMARHEIKNSWMSNYPNTKKQLNKNILKIKYWIEND